MVLPSFHPIPVQVKPFALICSFQVPTTELNPDFIPSVSVVIGEYETQEQAKQARQAIQHTALISAWCYHSFLDEDDTATANNGGV